jgi:alpha-1,6-mannosyltransferase
LLTFAAVVFRAEVVLYLGPLVLQLLLQRYISLTKVILVGVVSGFASIGKTPIFFYFTKIHAPSNA